MLVERVHSGRPVAHVAAEMGISRTTAHKWDRRFSDEGGAGLHDRSSRPRSTPHRTTAAVEEEVCRLRQDRKLDPARIGPILRLPASTVHRILTPPRPLAGAVRRPPPAPWFRGPTADVRICSPWNTGCATGRTSETGECQLPPGPVRVEFSGPCATGCARRYVSALRLVTMPWSCRRQTRLTHRKDMSLCCMVAFAVFFNDGAARPNGEVEALPFSSYGALRSVPGTRSARRGRQDFKYCLICQGE